jgi:hypothetical protein
MIAGIQVDVDGGQLLGWENDLEDIEKEQG